MEKSEIKTNFTEKTKQRFRLPSEEIEYGRSQPKRTPPKRRGSQKDLLRRIALSIATFLISLALISFAYGLFISRDFFELSLENGTTAAIALLIGCFALPLQRRVDLNLRRNTAVCFMLLIVTPWTYQVGNQMEQLGHELAPGFNFVFEIALAVALYRIVSKSSPARTQL